MIGRSGERGSGISVLGHDMMMMMMVYSKRFGFNNLLQDFKIINNVVLTEMDVCRRNKKKKVYVRKDS